MNKKKKIIIVVVAILVVLFIIGGIQSALNPETDQEDISASESQSANQENNANGQESEMPIIAGSNAYDISLSLKENAGLPEAERADQSDGYLFSASNSNYQYSITTDKSYAVSYARFFVTGEDDGFLGYCASFPYDSSSSDEAMKWVNDNIGTEATTTIGDAIFTLSVGNNGPILEIKAIGRDDYVANALK